MTTASELLAWLDGRHLAPAAMGQADLDRFLEGRAKFHSDSLRAFVRFLVARTITPKMSMPQTGRSDPQVFNDVGDRAALLRTCLTETAMSHAARITGALALLVGIPSTARCA
ncbi:hypothetical protein [Streptodolium elevatio]|uniref:Uncharacterized protein n=1 Tax=Streptodolium elevatio TaxID=3157996 RepID=A0ABV3DRC1_9ACTN